MVATNNTDKIDLNNVDAIAEVIDKITMADSLEKCGRELLKISCSTSLDPSYCVFGDTDQRYKIMQLVDMEYPDLVLSLVNATVQDIQDAVYLVDKIIKSDGEYLVDLDMCSGAYGVWFPVDKAEMGYAKYWSTVDYTWERMLDDIEYALGDADAICSYECLEYIEAADKVGDGKHARRHVKELLMKTTSDEMKQRACDAVDFESFTNDCDDIVYRILEKLRVNIA